jgi:hypothetical protein
VHDAKVPLLISVKSTSRVGVRFSATPNGREIERDRRRKMLLKRMERDGY